MRAQRVWIVFLFSAQILDSIGSYSYLSDIPFGRFKKQKLSLEGYVVCRAQRCNLEKVQQLHNDLTVMISKGIMTKKHYWEHPWEILFYRISCSRGKFRFSVGFSEFLMKSAFVICFAVMMWSGVFWRLNCLNLFDTFWELWKFEPFCGSLTRFWGLAGHDWHFWSSQFENKAACHAEALQPATSTSPECWMKFDQVDIGFYKTRASS